VSTVPYDAWLHWIVNDTCNFSCAYCSAGNSWKYDSYDAIDIDKVVHSIERTGKTFLVRLTGGGEPFLTRNLPELCLRLAERHYLGFNTNLIPARARTLFSQLSPSRVVELHCSVHFAELERQDLHARFIDTAQMVMARGFLTAFTGVAYPRDKERLPEWVEMYRRHGIAVKLTPFRGECDGKTYPQAYTEAEERLYGFTSTAHYFEGPGAGGHD
jgi:molybdenum cofactor biosynthesis enzyme MoaA